MLNKRLLKHEILKLYLKYCKPLKQTFQLKVLFSFKTYLLKFSQNERIKKCF